MYIDLDDFWREIELVAKNNYGSWKTKDEAVVNINSAISDSLDDLKLSMLAEQEAIEELAEDMSEASND